MRSLILLIITLLFPCWITAQADSSYIRGDTLTDLWYFKDGRIMREKQSLKDWDWFSFHSDKGYYRNGNPKWIMFHNEFADSSCYLSGRRNGTIKLQSIHYRNISETTTYNRKGELQERQISQSNTDSVRTEVYQNGKLISTTSEFKPRNELYLNQYPIITHYQGQPGSQDGVIIIDKGDTILYNVNGRLVSKDDFMSFEKKRDEFIKSRQEVHFYKQYTSDSVLVYDGLFTEGELPCGVYHEYYPDGRIKLRGHYNNKGKREGRWHYYDRVGKIIKFEFYNTGKLIQPELLQN